MTQVSGPVGTLMTLKQVGEEALNPFRAAVLCRWTLRDDPRPV